VPPLWCAIEVAHDRFVLVYATEEDRDALKSAGLKLRTPRKKKR
jgi:hypothetical protein